MKFTRRDSNSFFSLAFSSSSAFSRLASDTIIPEYFAIHAQNVPSDIPCCGRDRRIRARLVLLQNADDLFFRQSCLLDRPSFPWAGLKSQMEEKSRGRSDRLLAAGVDERLWMDIMGHQIKRKRYGAGGELEQLQRVVKLIAPQCEFPPKHLWAEINTLFE
jgi:hypothetical protein